MPCIDGWAYYNDGTPMGIQCTIIGSGDGQTSTSVNEFDLQRAMDLLGQLRDRSGVDGPGLPGLGFVGDWLEALKRWLQGLGLNWWWLLLAGVAVLVIAND